MNDINIRRIWVEDGCCAQGSKYIKTDGFGSNLFSRYLDSFGTVHFLTDLLQAVYALGQLNQPLVITKVDSNSQCTHKSGQDAGTKDFSL